MHYALLKPILFRMDPEKIHDVSLRLLQFFHTVGLARYFPCVTAQPLQVMGLSFANPIGLAAGFDKNGDYIDALASLGFGFIEVGTVTPQPEVGNAKPRLFRVPQHEAIINRMGFNNKGVDYLVSRIKQMSYTGVLGVNIGKGRSTPMTQVIDDYLYCFRRVALYASYVVINVSSPKAEYLSVLLQTLKAEQALFLETQHKYVPLVLKISPDMSEVELQEMIQVLRKEKMDAVIATSTSLNRDIMNDVEELGGLSGKPLSVRSTAMIKQLSNGLGDEVPIIASGGIMNEQDALDKLNAGASLLQLYTGLIYRGPSLVRDLLQ